MSDLEPPLEQGGVRAAWLFAAVYEVRPLNDGAASAVPIPDWNVV
jgi:hypothetical protein